MMESLPEESHFHLSYDLNWIPINFLVPTLLLNISIAIVLKSRRIKVPQYWVHYKLTCTENLWPKSWTVQGDGIRHTEGMTTYAQKHYCQHYKQHPQFPVTILVDTSI